MWLFECQNKSREDAIRQATSQLHTLQQTISDLEAHNKSLHAQLHTRTQELSTLTQQLTSTHTQLHSLHEQEATHTQTHAQLAQLQGERERWMHERVSLLNEIAQLKPLDEALNKLTNELVEFDERMQQQQQQPQQPPRRSSLAASSTSTKHSNNSTTAKPSAAQMHAGWIGIPTLRSLCPTLYTHIRSLHTDVITHEHTITELRATISVLEHDLAHTQQQHSQDQQRLLHTHELTETALAECRARVAELERECVRARGAHTVLEQVRVVLMSFPGGIDVLFSSNGGNDADMNAHGLGGSDVVNKALVFGTPLAQAQAHLSTPPSSEGRSRFARMEEEIRKVCVM